MYQDYLKRILDFTISTILLIVLIPIISILFVLLLIANQGSPLFFQDRPGKNSRIFRLVNFKSMNERKDATGKLLPDKDRLTPVGRFIRSTSMVELPQLINVLKGDMSLIGPRPLMFE